MLLTFFLLKTKKITQENPDTVFMSLFSPLCPSEIHNFSGAVLVPGTYVVNTKYSPKGPVRIRDLFCCVSQILSTPSQWNKENGIQSFWHP